MDLQWPLRSSGDIPFFSEQKVVWPALVQESSMTLAILSYEVCSWALFVSFEIRVAYETYLISVRTAMYT